MTLAANSASAWPSPQTAGKLSRDDAVRYLERIKLPASTVEASPSLDLLKKLQRAHMLAVPFESTSIHVKEWRDDRAEIGLGGGEPVALAEGAFRHIVSLKRGGYCFSLNGSFASLLRSFGYNVSECLAKVNSIRKDPAVHGVEWEALSHLVSIVDWQGSDGRYLSDVGFGSGPTEPIPMRDGCEVASIPSTDVYRLSLHDSLPYVSTTLLPDQAPTWMLSRRLHTDVSTSPRSDFLYIPQYAFQLLSTSHRDIRVMNHYQGTSREAVFNKLFVTTLLHDNGERTTLSFHDGSFDEKGSKAAKLTRTRLTTRDRNDEVLETRFVPFSVAAIKGVLKDEFGMEFPSDYAGN